MVQICKAPAAIHGEVWSLTYNNVGQSGGFFGGLFGGGGKEESPSPEKAVQPPAEETPAAEPVPAGTPAKEEEKPREESPAFETPASTPAKPRQEEQEQEQEQEQGEQVAEQPTAAAEEARNVASGEEQVVSKPATLAASKPVKQPKKASGGSCQVCLSHSDCGDDAFPPSHPLHDAVSCVLVCM